MKLLAEQKQTHRHRKQTYGYQRGQVRGWEGWTWVWDWHMHTEVYGMTGQQGPAVEHRELYPGFCHHLCGKRIRERMDAAWENPTITRRSVPRRRQRNCTFYKQPSASYAGRGNCPARLRTPREALGGFLLKRFGQEKRTGAPWTSEKRPR